MNSIVRRAGRGSTLLVGSVALAFSLAACGGGSEDPAETTAEETAAEEAAEETTEAAEETTEESAEATEEGAEDPAAGGEVTEEDLTAAKESFLGFLNAVGEGDYAAACGFMLDPTTNEPMSGEMQEGCASGLEGSGGTSSFTPDMVAMIEENLEATDNGDGTIALSAMGQDMGMQMVKGSDGKWYIDSSALLASQSG